MELKENTLVKYSTMHGDVELSPRIIRNFLVSGNAENVTHQEVAMFLNLCRYQKLNPFLREAYLVKFGNHPATIVTGKETFTKRAMASGRCKGWEAGVIVTDKAGTVINREGTFMAKEDALVGGWAHVYRDDWAVPLKLTVSLSEYQRFKNDGTLMANWKSMPATMIRKVALVQALREAFPEDFQGMYSPEEMPIDDTELSTDVIEVEVVEEGELGDEPPAPAPAPTQTKAAPPKEEKKINTNQAKRMFARAKDGGGEELVKKVMATKKYEKTSDILLSDYDELVSMIDKKVSEVLKAREEGAEPADEPPDKGGLSDEELEEACKQVGLLD